MIVIAIVESHNCGNFVAFVFPQRFDAHSLRLLRVFHHSLKDFLIDSFFVVVFISQVSLNFSFYFFFFWFFGLLVLFAELIGHHV